MGTHEREFEKSMMEMQMSQTVAHTLVDVLEKIGVTHIFGLIADSLNPIGDAVRHSKIEWVGVRHEEGAALAAAGQAKLTGRLGVCCGSTGPGSTHLVAGLYEACRDHAPVLMIRVIIDERGGGATLRSSGTRLIDSSKNFAILSWSAAAA
jgi:glyoxylate carboligase